MGRRTFTVEEKKAIATGWAEARAAGESQQSYAARWSASPRRVREFVREYAPHVGPRLPADAQEAVRAAIEALLRLSSILKPPLTAAGDPPVPARASDAPVCNGKVDLPAAMAVDEPREDKSPSVSRERSHTLFNWDL